MKNIIEIKGLCKSFKDVKAVQDLSFCVREGELFAFLGVNGAGKSTTISILCGILSKDRGQVCVDGVVVDSRGDDAEGNFRLCDYVCRNYFGTACRRLFYEKE